MKNAIGYLRVSTKGQSEDGKFGLEAQKSEIIKYANEHDFRVVEWCKDVVSGVSEDRPALNTILFHEDVKNPPYEAVLVYKSDRIARDIKLYFYYSFLLERKGIKLISINDGFSDIPSDFKNIIQSFVVFSAEQERKNITIRTTAGRLQKASKGQYAGGRTPYGYKVVRGLLVPNESQAPIIKMIFEMREKRGMTLQAIADYLNDSHIMTQFNRRWERASVKSIIDNKKFYQGYYRYASNKWIKGEQEAIIEEDGN